jgi:hypothetical protein
MTVTATLNPTPMMPLRLVAMTVPARSDSETKGKVDIKAFLLGATEMTTMLEEKKDTSFTSVSLWQDADRLLALEKSATASCEGLFVALRPNKKKNE